MMAKILSNDFFGRLHHSVNMLNSLQSQRDVFVLDRNLNPRIFAELKEIQSFLAYFEDFFLKILVEDLRDIAKAAAINPENYEKAKETIEETRVCLEKFAGLKNEPIAKSYSLASPIESIRKELSLIERDIDVNARVQERHKNSAKFSVTSFYCTKLESIQ